MCREVDLYTAPLMASLGDSKEDPIVLDSPLSSARVPVSPIKVLSSPESAQKCRYVYSYRRFAVNVTLDYLLF